MCCYFFQPEKAQGKRKKRAKKDADAPKRPMSAYMLWLGEVREQLKQENPGISVTELSKVAGERWKQIDDKTVSFTQGCLVISERILRRNCGDSKERWWLNGYQVGFYTENFGLNPCGRGAVFIILSNVFYLTIIVPLSTQEYKGHERTVRDNLIKC